jgi:predicted RNA binding protein YcfA (HicA-like mRNA interferase family)
LARIAPVSYGRLAKVLEKKGFRLVRQKGDHMIYSKEGVVRPIVIPKYDNIPVFVILNNLRSAGISREEYLSLLETV